MAKPYVYRLEELPENISRDDIKCLFKKRCESLIKITSLSKTADWNEHNRTLTATFLYTPKDSSDRPELHDSHYYVDRDFYGFTPLYTPDGTTDADVIALAGMGGHAFGSWAVSSEQMWLRDHIPCNFPRCRILTYGYDAQLENGQSRGILYDHSNNFILKLRDLRDQSKCPERPIVFIGHSLGCLIIKEVLVNLHSFNRKNDLAPPPIAGLIFIGAPHRGLEIASLRTLVSNTPPEDLVAELKRDSPTLTRLNADFKELYGHFDILTIFELRDTPSARQKEDGSWDKDGPLITMVPRDSAILYWEKEQTLGVNQHHREMARIGRGQSSCYAQIRGFMQRSLGKMDPSRSLDVITVSQRTKMDQSEDGGSGTLIWRGTYPKHGILRIDSQSRSSDVVEQTKGSDENGEGEMSESPTPTTSEFKGFFKAVEHGIYEEVETHLDRGVEVDCFNGDNDPAICVAACHGKIEIVRFLLQRGADVNIRNSEGCTPLHSASSCSEVEVMKLLLETGADIEAFDMKGRTSFHLARCVEAVQILLHHGANVNARDSEGKTLLHLAARNESPAFIQLLFNNGADFTITDTDGWTALHYASYYNTCQSVRTILAAGADPFGLTKEKMETCLHLAAKAGKYSDTIDILIAAGIDVNARNIYDWTPLHHAQLSGGPEITRRLLRQGALVNAITEKGQTALLFAADCSGPANLNLLIGAGAMLNIPGDYGWTPLHWAVRFGKLENVGRLLSAGADTFIRDEEGRTVSNIDWEGYYVPAGTKRAIKAMLQNAERRSTPLTLPLRNRDPDQMDWAR